MTHWALPERDCMLVKLLQVETINMFVYAWSKGMKCRKENRKRRKTYCHEEKYNECSITGMKEKRERGEESQAFHAHLSTHRQTTNKLVRFLWTRNGQGSLVGQLVDWAKRARKITHTNTHKHRQTKTLVDSCQLAAKQFWGETMGLMENST